MMKKKKEFLEEIMQENLLRGALELLLKNGWEGITMEKVANEAGVSKGTIYNYFKDKEDLMKHLMNNLAKPYLASMRDIAESDITAPEKIDKMIDYALFDLFQHRDLIKAIMEVHLKIHYNNKMEDLKSPNMVPLQICNMFSSIIEEGITSGEFLPVNPQAAAILIQGGLMSAMRWVSVLDEPLRLEALQNTFKNIVFNGLANRGREE